MQKHNWIMKVAALAFVAVALSGCMDGHHSRYGGGNVPSSFSSEGERLYFTGVSSSGERIRPVGGHHHMQMHGGSCATCHGAGKDGGEMMWPRFWVVAPALTDGALQSDHDDGHDHASYDEASLKKAIVNGIAPDGEPLHGMMPRWRMSEESLNALVHYLLGGHSH
jgi:mono/diheme cytochrome c family protein